MDALSHEIAAWRQDQIQQRALAHLRLDKKDQRRAYLKLAMSPYGDDRRVAALIDSLQERHD